MTAVMVVVVVVWWWLLTDRFIVRSRAIGTWQGGGQTSEDRSGQ